MARSYPDWPRMMSRATASAYCDLSAVEFEREVASARLPLPVKLGDREHWSRVTLDAALERLTGDHVPDWRQQAPLYGRQRDAA